MLPRLAAVYLALALTLAQVPPGPPSPAPREPEVDPHLPNGKNQRDEILKAEYKKSLQDADDLLRLADELKSDLTKATPFVVSVSAIKKTEDIEKLAKRIRGRMKRS